MEENGKLLLEHLTTAVVLRGPYQDFLTLLDFLSTLPETRVIYKRKAWGKLWITEREPNK